ncbi:unnamed protein product [Calicophoron daubneyi]|uniref:EF-hand domain-containing protein n=1 Tax=Calicophoron daubneyi TaxID=300641 RepID=A0AAV2T5C0_CALDB
MEPFCEAFFCVDTDGDEKIHIRDLEDYVKRNNLDPAMVSQWKNLFDKKGTGVITLQEFCDTLGLRLADVRVQRESFRKTQAAASRLNPDIRVIQATMPPDQQYTVSEELIRITSDKNLTPKEVADRLKKYLEDKYGRIWDVVVSDGSCWCSFSHIPETSFFFQYHKYVYLIWKTPE